MTSPGPSGDAVVPRLDDGPVTLRAPRPEDLDEIVRHGQDPQMRTWTQVPDPFTRTDAEEFLARVTQGWRRGTEYGFMIESGGRWAGSLNLRPQGLGLAEIGFSAAAWARGRSVLSRAVRRVLRWAFEDLGLDVVRWSAHVGNWPSRRLAWACGFRHEGTVTALLEQRGRRVDGWVATLRRGEPLSPPGPWWEPVALTGGGVRLRPHADADDARMAEACRDPQSRHWLPTLPEDYSPAHAREHIAQVREQAAAGRAVAWAVCAPDDDAILGEFLVAARDDERRHGELGYWLHPDARGRGIATAAGRLAVRHALLPAEDGGLGMDRLLLRAAVGNRPSRRVAERLGFTRSGLDRDGSRLRDGSRVDDVRYDLLPDELRPAGSVPDGG